MPNIFKKISRGTTNFFKKADSTVTNIVKKTPNVLDKIGNGITNVADKTGNFLEKNSAIIGDVAGVGALALGQPELAMGAFEAGNSGAQLGTNLKADAQASRMGPSLSTSVGDSVKQYAQNAKNNAMMQAQQAQQAPFKVA